MFSMQVMVVVLFVLVVLLYCQDSLSALLILSFYCLLGGTNNYKVLMDQFHHVSTAFLELGKGLVRIFFINICLILIENKFLM